MYNQLFLTLPGPVPPEGRTAEGNRGSALRPPHPYLYQGSQGYLSRSSLRAPEPQLAARGRGAPEANRNRAGRSLGSPGWRSWGQRLASPYPLTPARERARPPPQAGRKAEAGSPTQLHLAPGHTLSKFLQPWTLDVSAGNAGNALTFGLTLGVPLVH